MCAHSVTLCVCAASPALLHTLHIYTSLMAHRHPPPSLHTFLKNVRRAFFVFSWVWIILVNGSGSGAEECGVGFLWRTADGLVRNSAGTAKLRQHLRNGFDLWNVGNKKSMNSAHANVTSHIVIFLYKPLSKERHQWMCLLSPSIVIVIFVSCDPLVRENELFM